MYGILTNQGSVVNEVTQFQRLNVFLVILRMFDGIEQFSCDDILYVPDFEARHPQVGPSVIDLVRSSHWPFFPARLADTIQRLASVLNSVFHDLLAVLAKIVEDKTIHMCAHVRRPLKATLGALN